MVQYITSGEFLAAKTGAKTVDIGSAELDNYIQRACSLINEYVEYDFSQASSVVENLWTGSPGNVTIDNAGVVAIYPRQYRPITAVNSISWLLRVPRSGTIVETPTPTTLSASDWEIDQDDDGAGYRILVFADFSAYRHPDTRIKFTVDYDGGYSVYPDWLKQSAILWTIGLLKRRGAQGPQMAEGGGFAPDFSALAGEIRDAKAALYSHKRRF